MTPAEIARAMGEHIRRYGFTPSWNNGHACGCFARAFGAVCGMGYEAGNAAEWRAEPMATLRDVIDADFWQTDLSEAGWTEGEKRDAAAACDIAADLLS